MLKVIVTWYEEGKYFETKEPGFGSGKEEYLTAARASLIDLSHNGVYLVLFEDFDKLKYVRVGPVRRDLEEAIRLASKTEIEAKMCAFRLICDHAREIMQRKSYNEIEYNLENFKILGHFSAS